MWFLKLIISILIIPFGFLLILCYLYLIQKIFRLEDNEFGYTFPIGSLLLLFFILVYEIYINLPF